MKNDEKSKATEHIQHLDEVSDFFKIERIRGSSAVEKLFATIEADRAEFSDAEITDVINRFGKRARWWGLIHDRLTEEKSTADKSANREAVYQDRIEREHAQREQEICRRQLQKKERIDHGRTSN